MSDPEKLLWKNWEMIGKVGGFVCIVATFATANLAWAWGVPIGICIVIYAGYKEMRSGD
ncbi:hypothetical protein [Fuerstiella marisgermanici]|uniref:Uncharacterized protein n=1 Tax=Fuerstiella marisgermanici TaxID=1891926 RepID=A0A1P8WN76_9PLAN|nr:hypothetical protein [Fuerstiella marisgermanici]APZ95498.1 hypothetical protein Fuma_05156 [Fuerstiella marisgermanici]